MLHYSIASQLAEDTCPLLLISQLARIIMQPSYKVKQEANVQATLCSISSPFETTFDDPETGIPVRAVWSFKQLRFEPAGTDLSRRFTRGQIAVTASRCQEHSRGHVWDERDVIQAVEGFSGHSIFDFLF